MRQILSSLRQVKVLFFIVLSSFFSLSARASTGDTLVVHGFSNFLHQNCNSGTGTYAFPNDSLHFYKIMLRYELSCPGFGCDIYDRIATLKVLHGTGVYDSTLTLAPGFTVNGAILDSLQFMNDTSYHYSYNTSTLQIDSTPLPQVQVIFFGDSLNPLSPTDTLNVWPAYYNNYIFDVNGIATDSMAVVPDSTIYLSYDSLYSVPFEIREPFEIARSITPYGQGVVLWFDVSDYREILKDSVTLYSVVCGYSNGWQVTTDFYFIEGLPYANPSGITNLWNGTFSYGNTGNPIENHLQPIDVVVDSQAVYSKVRLVTTGHGFGGYPNQDVAEFYDVTHFLVVNGDSLSQHLWRSDCGRNPLYPQGAPGYTSTWFYKRANWCPGSYVTPHDYNVTSYASPGSTLNLDYNMVPYTVTGGPSGFYAPEYYIQSQFFTYDSLNYSNNAGVLSVSRPNGAFEFNRINPACDGVSPEVLIKNFGKDTLTSIVVNCLIDGLSYAPVTVPLHLAFLDTVTITLPPVTFGAGNHTCDIFLENPNGVADEFLYDDTAHTAFTATNVYDMNGIWLQLRNDGSPNEASWDVRDAQGTVLYSRSGFSTAYGLYSDSIFLPNGCYSVSVYDSYGDGLCCYGGGQGFFSINTIDGTVLRSVRDFGEFYTLNLTLDYTLGVVEPAVQDHFTVYPNPASGKVTLNTSFTDMTASVELTDLSGRIVREWKESRIEGYRLSLDLSQEADGLYFLKMNTGEKSVTGKILVQHN